MMRLVRVDVTSKRGRIEYVKRSVEEEMSLSAVVTIDIFNAV